MEKGSTERILQPFLEGAREAGAETEVVYVARQKINYCKGCLNCWIVHPGRCVHNDDIPEIQSKIKYSDILVYASPVYFDGFTAQMKTMMDRFVIGAKPDIEIVEGHSRHPSRGKGIRKRKVVLLSTCGFGENDNFDVIIHHMKAASKNMRAEYMGALIRPMGPLLKFMTGDKIDAVYNAFLRAGYDAVTKGEISEEIQEAASRQLMPMEDYAKMLNFSTPRK